MGSLDQVLSGVQQAAQVPPVNAPVVPPSPAKSDVPGFQDVLGGVKAQASGQLPPITADEDSVTRSMLQKRAMMSDAHQTLLDNSATRILAAGGQGIADVGAQILRQQPMISEEEINKSVPINGEDNWLKGIGKDVIREGIRTYGQAAGIANMVMNAFGGGIPLGATQQMLQQTGKETGSDIPDALAAGLNDPAMLAILHQMQGVPVHDVVTKPPLPHDVYRAIDNGIMEPSDPAMKSEAAQYVNAQALPKDVHEAARQIAPETFHEYDALQEQHQILSSQMRELSSGRQAEIEASAPHTQEIGALQDRLETENLSERKTQRLQERIDDLKSKNRDYVEQESNKLSPEMESIRQSQEAIRGRLSEIAGTGAIRAAYQEAASRMPHVETVEPEAPQIKPEEQPSPAGAEVKEATQNTVAGIAQDVEQKLTAAGRPVEEAQAAAQLVQAHYEARAARFGGKRGTAQEMYERDGTTIKAGRERASAKELAQDIDKKANKEDNLLKEKANAENETGQNEHSIHPAELLVAPTGSPGPLGAGPVKLYSTPESVREATRSGQLNQQSAKAGLCFQSAGEIAESNNLPVVIGTVDNGKGTRIYHAVNLIDKGGHEYIYDATLDKAFTADAYNKAVGKWYPVKEMSPADVREHGQRFGTWPDHLNLGLPDAKRVTKDTFNDLNRGPEYDQKARGKIRLGADETKATITLMKTADASTFIHETGHHWLDELMKDSAHELAPEDLKFDAAAVRKWLGTEGEITTRQHEKFARGFERYMMEGVAPSRGLAKVFEKFKNWLTNIYQTVSKLRSPITDDIRGVFDRLLSTNPEKTIIAPDRAPGKAIADIHEADARETPPAQKDAVGDNVENEIDHTAKLHEPEIADAIKAAETSNIQEPTSGDTGIAETGERPQQGGTSEESGTVASRGGESEAGGAGPRAEPAAERGGAERVPPKSKPVEKLFDKAGNIRLENLTNDEEVLSALRTMAQKYPQVLNHEVVSDVQVAEFARDLGKKGDDTILDKLRGMAAEDGVPLASYVRASREMLAKAHDEAIAFAEKVKDGTRADFLNAMEAKDRFMMLAATVSETANELGRALRAFQDISGAKASAMEMNELFQQAGTTEGEMKDLFQLIASKKATGIKGQAAKVMQAASKPGFWDTFAEYRRCSILSGWVTHSLWLAGTGFNLAYKGLVLDTLGGLHNEIRILAGGKDTGSRITGGLEGLTRSITKALPNILSATGTAIRTGKTVLRPFEGEFDTFLATGGIRKTLNVDMDALKAAVEEGFNEDDFADLKSLREKMEAANEQGNTLKADAIEGELKQKSAERKSQLAQTISAQMQNRLKSWSDIGHEMSDFGSSVLSGVEAVGKNMVSPDFYKGKPLLEARRNGGAVPDVYAKGVPILPVGSALRAASSVIYSSMHTFTREIAANVEVAQEARRMAVEEGAKDVEARRNELLADPSKELMQRVNHIANKQTLMSSESQFAKMMTLFRNRMDDWGAKTVGINKIGSILFPVIGVPAEAAAQLVVENSPFGLAFKGQRAALAGRQGALAAERAQVKMAAGSALLGLGYWLASEGMVTPSPSVNYKQEQERRDAGKQSGSVRAGDWMVSLAHVPITGALLTLGADLHHMSSIQSGQDESEKLKPAFESAVNNFFLHENALVEMSSLVDMMRGKTDPAAYLKNQADSLVPQFISQTNNVLDPLQRDTKGFVASLVSRIPGESEGLAPRINALTGEPLAREPFHINTAIPDPIASNLLNLHMYPTNPKATLNGAELNPMQAAEYNVVKGHILHDGLNMLMLGDGKDDYAAADNDGKRKMVQRIERHAADCSKSVMFNRHPDILKDANDRHEAECRNELQ